MTGACANLSQHYSCRRCTDSVANIRLGHLKNFVRVNSDLIQVKTILWFLTIERSIAV